MITILQSVLAFVFALGLLITFHEFGHYWVARRCNVKILRFSVGFGKPLWQCVFGQDKTEFVIAALPLGGYVKMLDEREGSVNIAEKDRAFNSKPLRQRVAIVLAGPAFNFLFAIFAYWMCFMIGADGLKPVIAEIEKASLAEQAGFMVDDQIMQVAGQDTATWTAVFDEAVRAVVKGEKTVFLVTDTSGAQRELLVHSDAISVDEMADGMLLKRLGLKPKRPIIPAIIGLVTDAGAAQQAGLLPGDQVIAVDGRHVKGWIEWVEIIRSKPGQTLAVKLLRGDNELTLALTPHLVTDKQGKRIGRIGAGLDNRYARESALFAKDAYAVLPALVKAIDKTIAMSLMTLRILGKMLIGEASVKNLSGPITIAQYAGASAGLGVVTFLSFLGIISVSLGVLNLLPIPLLDGGHLVYYLAEFVKGSPVSESVQIVGQQVGLGLLLGLMSLAFYNDILRLLG